MKRSTIIKPEQFTGSIDPSGSTLGTIEGLSNAHKNRLPVTKAPRHLTEAALKNLNAAPINSLGMDEKMLESSREMANKVNTVAKLGVDSTKTIFEKLKDKAVDISKSLLSDEYEGKGVSKAKTVGMSVLGGVAGLVGLKSGMQVLNGFLSRDPNRPPLFWKFIEASFAWVFAGGIFNTLRGKGQMFGKTFSVAAGAVGMLLINLLNKFYEGKFMPNLFGSPATEGTNRHPLRKTMDLFKSPKSFLMGDNLVN